jgi:hypothetical protein
MREEVGKGSTGDAEGSVVTGGLAVGESALLSERRSLSLLDGRTCAGIEALRHAAAAAAAPAGGCTVTPAASDCLPLVKGSVCGRGVARLAARA